MPRRRTEQKKKAFLEAIQRGLYVTDAADHAKVDRTTPYAWEREDKTFRSDWELVRDLRPRQLTDTAMDLALEGDTDMLKFMINRFDRQSVSRERQTVAEIAIIPAKEAEDGQPSPSFITLEEA